MSKLRIAFDIGGVLSAHSEMRTLFDVCRAASRMVDVFIVTDMPQATALDMLRRNKVALPAERVLSADYVKHGGMCKAMVMRKHRIRVLFDDAINYATLTDGYDFVRLLVMPMAQRSYYSRGWKTPKESGNFGRSKYRPKTAKR